MLADTDRAIAALHAIPPTIDHDTRARVGMAAKDAGVTFDDYDAWQATNPRYNAGEVRSMWNSYGDGPVKAGTLFKVAAEHGYRMNGSKPQQRPIQAPSKPVEPAAQACPWHECRRSLEPLRSCSKQAPLHHAKTSRWRAPGCFARGACWRWLAYWW